MMKKIIYISLMISILMLLGLNTGCGKKGQPFALFDHRILPPYNIEYKLKNDILTLKWTYPSQNNNLPNLEKFKKFQIFQAKKSILKNKCKTCPIKFKQIGSVSGKVFQYTFKIEKNFKYYYKIMTLSEDNIASEFSNILEFEYK